MPNALALAIQDHPLFRGPEVSIRHNPEFGIAACPPHLRPPLPSGRR
jgi:hypothetical protein